jgi:hypothetical protein
VIEEALDAATGLTFLDPAESFSDLPVTGFEQKYLADGRSIRAFALEKMA